MFPPALRLGGRGHRVAVVVHRLVHHRLVRVLRRDGLGLGEGVDLKIDVAFDLVRVVHVHVVRRARCSRHGHKRPLIEAAAFIIPWLP
jgi:hypothetical protein